MSDDDVRFECHECDFATYFIERAEHHEHRTGHDVWEESS